MRSAGRSIALRDFRAVSLQAAVRPDDPIEDRLGVAVQTLQAGKAGLYFSTKGLGYLAAYLSPSPLLACYKTLCY
jgi:hypothetical protein